MKIQTILTVTSVVLLAITPWQSALAEASGERILHSAIRSAVDGTFSETERQLIGEYFTKQKNRSDEDGGGKKHKKGKKGKKQKGMPPGLARKKQLPPGLQKQLDRNGTLPPGLAKRNLPSNLEGSLPPVANGMERVIADTHVLLVDKATGVIKDIIKDIVQ